MFVRQLYFSGVASRGTVSRHVRQGRLLFFYYVNVFSRHFSVMWCLTLSFVPHVSFPSHLIFYGESWVREPELVVVTKCPWGRGLWRRDAFSLGVPRFFGLWICWWLEIWICCSRLFRACRLLRGLNTLQWRLDLLASVNDFSSRMFVLFGLVDLVGRFSPKVKSRFLC